MNFWPVNYFYRRVQRTNIWPDIGSRYATVKNSSQVRNSSVSPFLSPPAVTGGVFPVVTGGVFSNMRNSKGAPYIFVA